VDLISATDIAAPLVLINGFLLGGLSVMVVGGIARNVTRDDRVGVWAAALWAITPLFTYFAFFWHFDPVVLRSSMVPKVGWPTVCRMGRQCFTCLCQSAAGPD
jgi:hypothetical protein